MGSDDGVRRIERPRWRARLVRTFVAVVIIGQLFLVARSYDDPHNLFGFQPFNESSTWQVEIVRVTADGDAIPIDAPWPGGYDWDELVDWRTLQDLDRGQRHAYSGLGTMLDYLGEALDWVADNTPADDETAYLQATVVAYRNTRGPEIHVLRSHDRDRP